MYPCQDMSGIARACIEHEGSHQQSCAMNTQDAACLHTNTMCISAATHSMKSLPNKPGTSYSK